MSNERGGRRVKKEVPRIHGIFGTKGGKNPDKQGQVGHPRGKPHI